MPRYFFNIHTSDALIPDLEGSEFSGAAAALEEARKDARLMIAERIRNGEDIDGRVFEITDEKGAVVATLAFRDAITPGP
jgi:uncharacterized protein DUF6894